MKFEDLKSYIEEQQEPVDLAIIERAYTFAAKAHAGQKRQSGGDYIEHPLRTAMKLAQLKLDTATIAAGLLHDVPEDTKYTLDDVQAAFGAEIASLVSGITKIGKIKYRGADRFAESLRKMFVAMAEDLRVVFIKFADRLHNLETLSALAPVKQKRIAMETLEIYAPIAARLGMGKLRGELEDQAFRYAFPEEYKWITSIAAEKRQAQKLLVNRIIKETVKILKQHDIFGYTMHGRVKHDYSLYRKLLKPKYERDINKIYDLVAVRIIVRELRDCYLVLGLIHQQWKPLPEQIKDYIAQPKLNGYRSLHTVVFSENGHPVEFQIRTREMHEQAEYGVAAHFHFSETGKHKHTPKVSGDNLIWLKQLQKLQAEITEDAKFIEALKLDLFSKRIFIFTPAGDVVDLPEGACAIDFAYAIHTELGHQCAGAKINGKLTDLIMPLKNGDIVEIIPDKKRVSPSNDWLDKVQTQAAKDKIRTALRKQRQGIIDRLLNR